MCFRCGPRLKGCVERGARQALAARKCCTRHRASRERADAAGARALLLVIGAR